MCIHEATSAQTVGRTLNPQKRL